MPRFKQFQKRRKRFDPDKSHRWVREPFLGKPGETILTAVPNRRPGSRRRGLQDSYYTQPFGHRNHSYREIAAGDHEHDGYGRRVALPGSSRLQLGSGERDFPFGMLSPRPHRRMLAQPLRLPQLIIDHDTNASLLFEARGTGPGRLESIILSSRLQREMGRLRPEYHPKFMQLLGDFARADRFETVDQLVLNLQHVSKVLGETHGELRDRVYDFFFAHLHSIQPTLLAHLDSPDVTEKNVAMLMWCHANVGVQPAQELLDRVYSLVEGGRLQLSAIGIATMFWSLGKLRALPTRPVVKALSEGLIDRKDELTARGLSNVFCALGKLNLRPSSPLLKALTASSIANIDSFTPQGVTDTLTAFQRLKQRPPPALGRVLSIRAAERANRFPMPSVLQLFQAYRALDLQPHPRLAAVMIEAAARKANKWQPAQAREFLEILKYHRIPVPPQLQEAFQPYTEFLKPLAQQSHRRLVKAMHPMIR